MPSSARGTRTSLRFHVTAARKTAARMMAPASCGTKLGTERDVGRERPGKANRKNGQPVGDSGRNMEARGIYDPENRAGTPKKAGAGEWTG